MFKHNKFIKIIIALSVVMLIALIMLIFPSDPELDLNDLADISSVDAQAQSYTANSMLEIQKNDKMFGSENAQLKIFVYEDYANEYSADLADTLDTIIRENGNRVAVIVRPYITVSSLLSQQAFLAVDCAGKKWSKMRNRLFDEVRANHLSSDNLNIYADGVGLDEDKFFDCLNNADELAKVDVAVKEAKQYSVLGAPTIFIDDEMVLGARPYTDYMDSNGDVVEGLGSIVKRKLQ